MTRTIPWLYAIAAICFAGALVVICSMEARQPIPATVVLAAAALLNAAILLRRTPSPVKQGNPPTASTRSKSSVRVTWTLMESPIRASQTEGVRAQ